MVSEMFFQSGLMYVFFIILLDIFHIPWLFYVQDPLPDLGVLTFLFAIHKFCCNVLVRSTICRV